MRWPPGSRPFRGRALPGSPGRQVRAPTGRAAVSAHPRDSAPVRRPRSETLSNTGPVQRAEREVRPVAVLRRDQPDAVALRRFQVGVRVAGGAACLGLASDVGRDPASADRRRRLDRAYRPNPRPDRDCRRLGDPAQVCPRERDLRAGEDEPLPRPGRPGHLGAPDCAPTECPMALGALIGLPSGSPRTPEAVSWGVSCGPRRAVSGPEEQRLADVGSARRFSSGQVAHCPGDPEHSVEPAPLSCPRCRYVCAGPNTAAGNAHGRARKAAPGTSPLHRHGVTRQRAARRAGVPPNPRGHGRGALAGLTAANNSACGTGSTGMRRSMRSSSGPDTRRS